MLAPSSSSIGQLAGALAKAQTELVNPAKTQFAVLERGPNGSGGKCYRYAPLWAGPEVGAEGEMVLLTTTLAHSSGEWIGARWPVCRTGDLGNPQLMGAALTYARRYGLFALAGLAGEDDMDGAGFSGSEKSHGAGKFSLPVEPDDSAPDLLMQPLTSPHPAKLEPGSAEKRVRAPEKTGSDPARKGGDKPATTAAAVRIPESELALIEDADALFRWALQVVPLRNTLDGARRAELDAAFLARAEAVGADPELLIPFSSDPDAAERGVVSAISPGCGAAHATQATV